MENSVSTIPMVGWNKWSVRRVTDKKGKRGVSDNRPGWISVTRMGVFTTSRKSEPLNARTAALDAQYTLPPAYDSLPAIDPTLMTWPVLRALKSVGWISVSYVDIRRVPRRIGRTLDK